MKLQKSLSLSVAVLLMLCVVAACGSPAPAAPTGAFSEKDLGVEIGGKVYYLREDSAALLAALGDGFEYSEMVSCVYDGKDKTYTYPGITVNTVPVGGKDVIEMITLTDGAPMPRFAAQRWAMRFPPLQSFTARIILTTAISPIPSQTTRRTFNPSGFSLNPWAIQSARSTSIPPAIDCKRSEPWFSAPLRSFFCSCRQRFS